MFFSFFYSPGYLRAPSADRRKTLHMIAIWAFFIMQVQKFGRPSPPKKLGAKNMQNSARFQTTSDFDREYLRNGTGQDIQNRKDLMISDSSRNEKTAVNFGPLTTENCMWVWTHPNWIFREAIFRPLGGAGPSDFNTHYRLTKAC